jgi:hypothetical protein
MNQRVPHHDRPTAPVASCTAPTGSNVSGTARLGQLAVVQATRATTSAVESDTDHAPIDRGCRADGITTH